MTDRSDPSREKPSRRNFILAGAAFASLYATSNPTSGAVQMAEKKSVPSTKNTGTQTAPFVIVIDPGHGGIDPGAHARHAHMYEKTITLAVSKIIVERLQQEKDIEPILTRTADNTLSLTGRLQTAFTASAQMLVSIHANYNEQDSRLHGIEIYRRQTLHHYQLERTRAPHSRTAAGDEWLLADGGSAARLNWANSCAELGLNASHELQKRLAEKLGATAALANPNTSQMDLVVLRSPNIPSVLIELGYLSNAQDERELVSREGQEKIGNAIAEAIIDEVHSPRFQTQMAGLPKWPESKMQVASNESPQI